MEKTILMPNFDTINNLDELDPPEIKDEAVKHGLGKYSVYIVAILTSITLLIFVYSLIKIC